MKIIPVIDLLDGNVVRGIAGQREKYQPVQSCLATSTDPLSIATAFRSELNLNELYVADLDAILHNRPNLNTYRSLADAGFHIMVDAGLRDEEFANHLINAGADAVIAGLETSSGPEQLRRLSTQLAPQQVIFTLDMQNGQPLGHLDAWKTNDPFEIAKQAVEAGVSRMIVLDLAQVGTGDGMNTGERCRQLSTHFANLQIITGGGIRNIDDIHALPSSHVHAVLVASALHNRNIGRGEIESLRNPKS